MKFGKCLILAVPILAGWNRGAWADTPPSFVKDVQPFLQKYCIQCHNGKTAKSGINLETFETIMKGGKNKRPVLVAGDADKSRLVLCVEHKIRPMPPAKAKQPEDGEKGLLRAWILAGAR